MRQFPIAIDIGAADPGGKSAFASWLRPASYWTVVVHHLPLGLVAATALILPYCVTLDKLPQIPCTLRHLTGYPGPLCGFTRAFWAISTGHWGGAFVNSPLSFAVYLAVWIFFLWNGAALATGVVLSRGSALRMGSAIRRKTIAVALLLLAANWAYRVSMGWDVV